MIWLILSVGLILRLINLNQSLWLDEAISVLATQNFSLLGMITDYAEADFHPPLFFIIIWLWSKVFGISEIAVRIPSVIFGVLTVYIVYLIGKKLHSKTLGLFSALLLAINPLHVYYSQEARMYSLAAMAVSLNIFLLIKLLKGEKYKLIFLITSNILVFASDYVAYLIFPAQFIFLLFFKKREVIKKWFIAFTIAILSGILWIPIFLKQLDVGTVASANLPAWKFIVGGFDIKGVPLTFVKFIIGRISLDDKFIYAALLLPISILFLFLIWRAVKYARDLEGKLLIAWVTVPIILATIISFVIPIYSYFRLLFVLPAFIILISLGIVSLNLKVRYFFLTAVLLISLTSVLIYLFNHNFHREDWRGLVSFFKAQDGNFLILFESSSTLPPFDYYSKDSLNAKGGLKDFPAQRESDAIDLDGSIKEIYLLDYLVDISDPKRVIKRRLEGWEYKLVRTLDFRGIGFVYHYVK